MNVNLQESSIEEIVNKQLIAYNEKDYDTFASCYHENITSYDLETSKPNPKMSGSSFFDYYKNKFIENPKIHCHVLQRITHDNLIVDKERITNYQSNNHIEMVIYQVEQEKITKMWFSKEIAEEL